MLLYIPYISEVLARRMQMLSLQNQKTSLASAARKQVMFLPCLWVEAVILGACESNSDYAFSSGPLIEESQQGRLQLWMYLIFSTVKTV